VSVSSISPGNFGNFRPQTSKRGFGKGRDDICFACGKTGHWRVNCPTTNSYFTANHRTSSSQIKTPVVLLGSSDSISAQNAVKETLEGILDDVSDLEECFEFESSPSSIPVVKGRLRVRHNFWLHNLGASDFILRTIDKGYAVPFITVPPKALAHVDFVWQAVQDQNSSIGARLLRFPVPLMSSIPCPFPSKVSVSRG